MEKRVLLAIVLSIAVLVAYQYLFLPTMPPVNEEEVDPWAVEEEVDLINQAAIPVAPLALIPGVGIPHVERKVTIETDLYIAVLSSMGGTIESIELKKFYDKDGMPIVLKGDDLLPPLSLGADKGFQFARANFLLTRGRNIDLTAVAVDTTTLVFEYADGKHSIVRTFTFHNNSYGIDLRDEVSGLNSYWITLGNDFGIHEVADAFGVHTGPVILRGSDRMEFTAQKVVEPKSFIEGVRWIAQEDKYFFSAIVPKTQIKEARAWSKDDVAFVALKMDAGVINEYFIYAGPKERDRLREYGLGLEHMIDFGFFTIIALPLFWILKLFYSIFNNYGIAIIMLTIVVRIPFIPLINKSYKSMKKLQDVQPEMTKLREKYKKDPQKMQKEIIELYKNKKVNPLGGCLPMLLQLPVFFALYKVLLIAIELRGAPFILWITDLSVRDPIYILPIIMGATMALQMKMTPSTMDPMQQKLMMFMPIVLTILFLTFPSGLVLYWLVNNVLSIAQQFHINKKLSKGKGQVQGDNSKITKE